MVNVDWEPFFKGPISCREEGQLPFVMQSWEPGLLSDCGSGGRVWSGSLWGQVGLEKWKNCKIASTDLVGGETTYKAV